MTEEIKGLFGKKVRARRLQLGLTQVELGERANLHRSYIGEIELGRRNITLNNAEKIAIALHVDLIDLLK